MIMEGCQGKPQISIMDKICPSVDMKLRSFPLIRRRYAKSVDLRSTMIHSLVCNGASTQDGVLGMQLMKAL